MPFQHPHMAGVFWQCSLSSHYVVIRLADNRPGSIQYATYVQADGEVHDQLAAAEVPPFFALGWFITWFAHSVDNLQHASRLFDLFMAAHPLMPLYVTAIVIKVFIVQAAHTCTVAHHVTDTKCVAQLSGSNCLEWHSGMQSCKVSAMAAIIFPYLHEHQNEMPTIGVLDECIPLTKLCRCYTLEHSAWPASQLSSGTTSILCCISCIIHKLLLSKRAGAA